MDADTFVQNVPESSPQETPRRRSGNKWWKWGILGVVGVAVVAVLVVFLVIEGNKTVFQDSTEEISAYLDGEKTEEEIKPVIDNLINIIKESNDENKIVEASLDLSMLYNKDEEMVVSSLNKALERDLSAKNRYHILSTLAVIYKQLDKKGELMDTLVEIMKLPDNLEVEKENYPMMREYWNSQLESLKGECDVS